MTPTEPNPLEAAAAVDDEFCRRQLVTYLGNKRKLLPFIGQGVDYVRRRLGGGKLSCYDAFSGSGVVSRYLKAYASELYSNDMEPYAEVLGRCYLTNRSALPALHLPEQHALLLETIRREWAPGIIADLYAPADDTRIRKGERVFYTRRNAIYLDTARRAIAALPDEVQPYFLAPLLCEASVHTNTGGVFKGFYKNARGIGQFGGRARQALERIMADIELPLPLFSQHECYCEVRQGDAAATARTLPELDLTYLDPPYNEHPYGSNYFMLNLLVQYERPEALSPVSGIPQGWRRSAYNARHRAAEAFRELLAALPSKFALLSYNTEGLLSQQELLELVRVDWQVHTLEQEYPVYRAARNLGARSSQNVRELLFILERR